MSQAQRACVSVKKTLAAFTLNKNQPDRAVVVLPVNAAPDMFNVNNMLERLKSSEPKLLNKLL